VRNIKEFDEKGSYDETDVGLPGRKYDHQRRLPGPHYLLENAYMSQKEGDDEIQLPPGANPAVALAQAGLHASSPGISTPTMGGHDDWDTKFYAPEMPKMLQQARGLINPFDPIGVAAYHDGLPALRPAEQDNNLSPHQSYGFASDFASAFNHGRRLPLMTKNTFPLPLPSEHFAPQHSEAPSQSSASGSIYPEFGAQAYSGGSAYGPINDLPRGYHAGQ
jgi:hypothetical protein